MKNYINAHPVLSFCLLSYLITWMIQFPGLAAMRGQYQFNEQFLVLLNVSSYGPTLAALIVTIVTRGYSGIKSLLKRVVQWRVSLLVYLAVFFLFPLVSFLVYQALGIGAAEGENLFELFVTLVVLAPVNAIVGSILLDIGPLGEELGWRGFLLPRLHEKYGDLRASVILGLIWGFWHLPLFAFPEWRGDVPIWLAIGLYPISTIAIAYTMTKFHHAGKGSVLPAILYHGIVNYTAGYIQNTDLWDIGRVTTVGREVIIVALFIIMAVFTGLLFRRQSKRPVLEM